MKVFFITFLICSPIFIAANPGQQQQYTSFAQTSPQQGAIVQAIPTNSLQQGVYQGSFPSVSLPPANSQYQGAFSTVILPQLGVQSVGLQPVGLQQVGPQHFGLQQVRSQHLALQQPQGTVFPSLLQNSYGIASPLSAGHMGYQAQPKYGTVTHHHKFAGLDQKHAAMQREHDRKIGKMSKMVEKMDENVKKLIAQLKLNNNNNNNQADHGDFDAKPIAVQVR
ncbi:uncharacterized protein LOC129578291 [Sitodiplosis mosellana]|uniref:uncharacterized protein LOC129578291 n=1 Tax=Sitodiplosis mosellana TaxID=263140 RepID=UPI002443BB8C|nr:uncharacterized protein LOC129578291 [Sitodiplosis mosellana]